MLLVRLLRDPRIGGHLEVQLLTVSAHLISPFDPVPDLALPAGLADDTVAPAYMLSRVVALLGQAGEDPVREHWEDRGDVLAQVCRVIGLADCVLNRWARGWPRMRFGPPGASGRRVAGAAG